MRRFGDATEPALRELVAKALYGKGYRLGPLNRSEDAIGVCDDLVRRFGDATEPGLRELVAERPVQQGLHAGRSAPARTPLAPTTTSCVGSNRGEDAIGVYDEVVRRFGDAAEPSLRELVASALFSKGCHAGL